jgi:hypothetical protein
MATACSKSCRWMRVGRSFHCKSTAAPRHCKIRSSPSERGAGLSQLSSDAGVRSAPPSLSHLARALASGLLAFRLFGVLAIMHAIWNAEEPAATGNGAPCRPRQSDVAGGVEGAKVLYPYIAIVILQDPCLFFKIIVAAKSSITSCKAVTATPLNNQRQVFPTTVIGSRERVRSRVPAAWAAGPPQT